MTKNNKQPKESRTSRTVHFAVKMPHTNQEKTWSVSVLLRVTPTEETLLGCKLEGNPMPHEEELVLQTFRRKWDNGEFREHSGYDHPWRTKGIEGGVK